MHPDAIRSFNAARRLYLPGSYPEVDEDSFEFWTIVDEEWRKTQLAMQQIPDYQILVRSLSVLITSPTTQRNDTSSEKSSGSEPGEQNDASGTFEQKPESELDSAVNAADDRASN